MRYKRRRKRGGLRHLKTSKPFILHRATQRSWYEWRECRMLPSSDMSATPQIATAAYGLAAVMAWGTSDFLGGFASRRINAFVFTVLVNIGGLVMVVALASVAHAPYPSTRAAAWVLAGGISGGGALAIFYRALSTGRMGLTAPVAAVLGAAIPAVVSIFTEGLPGKI